MHTAAKSRRSSLRAPLALLVVAAALGAVAGRAGATYGGDTRPAHGRLLPAGPALLLSFDDGPSEVITPKVLAALGKRRLHAVFFVTGWRLVGKSHRAEQRRGLLHEEMAAGDVVGNHTYDHKDLCARAVSAAKVAWEIDHNADLIRAQTGYTPWLFRAPYGGIRCKKAKAAFAERHLVPIGWTIDSEDWKYRNTDKELRNTEHQIDEWIAGGGTFGIILMHDTQADTASAVPRLLAWIDARNAERTKKGEPPITFVDPSFLSPPLATPATTLADDALGWVRSIRWPDPLGAIADTLPPRL